MRAQLRQFGNLGRCDNRARRPVSRVLSRTRYPEGTGARGQPFVSATGCPAAPATNPGLSERNTPALAPRSAGARPLFGLAPGGVCHADAVTSAPVRSYRTLSPMPVRFGRHRRYTLCGTFPRLGLTLAGRALPATLISRSPDFPRHSLRNDAAARPPGRPYLVRPWSRSKSNWNRIARTSPSITPSILSGRQRRWNASTALRPSVISYPKRSSAR